jgi:hypothetical protein
MMTLTLIESQYKPEYQTISPRISAEWSSIKAKAGLDLSPKERVFLSEFSAYKRNAINSMNEYIKRITGAAMSDTEAKRILAGMPRVGEGITDGDSPTEFKAKMDDAIAQTKMSLARYEYIKRNGFTLSKPDGSPTVPLERMPEIMNKRGTELEQQMREMKVSEDVIAKRVRMMLAKEFGLIQ